MAHSNWEKEGVSAAVACFSHQASTSDAGSALGEAKNWENTMRLSLMQELLSVPIRPICKGHAANFLWSSHPHFFLMQNKKRPPLPLSLWGPSLVCCLCPSGAMQRGAPSPAASALPCMGLDAASRPRNQGSASPWLDPCFADCIAIVIHHKSIILRSSKGHFKEVKSLTKYIENLRHFKDLWKHFAWGLLGSFSLAWLLGPGEAQPNCLGHTEQILHSPWDPCRPKSLNFCVCSWGDGGIFASSYKLGYWVRAWGTGLVTHSGCSGWVALSSCACEFALSRILCEDLNCLLLFLLKFFSFKREEGKKRKRQLLRNKPQNNTKQTPTCSHSSPTLPLCMTSPSNVNLTSHFGASVQEQFCAAWGPAEPAWCWDGQCLMYGISLKWQNSGKNLQTLSKWNSGILYCCRTLRSSVTTQQTL